MHMGMQPLFQVLLANVVHLIESGKFDRHSVWHSQGESSEYWGRLSSSSNKADNRSAAMSLDGPIAFCECVNL